MRYSFRLAELLGHVPDPRKRPGTIKSIVEYTGLDRHQVAALLKNEVKYIPLKALSRLCDYLIEHGFASADQLPGSLFAIESENFWELLARRRRLELCLGVRQTEQTDYPEGALLMASDSVLLGELLNGVSTLGGTKIHWRDGDIESESTSSIAPHPEHLKQALVWSPGQVSDAEVRSRADQVYNEFGRSTSDKALICLGSMKSNPVFELILAGAFGDSPFAQNDISHALDRRCPIYLRYRNFDPCPPSCCGGLSLASGHESETPGLYYETASGKWKHCAWTEQDSDVALVFYIHRESQGWLEMALAGFSGRATRLLAKTLAARAEDFWPPIYSAQGVHVGAFVVQYTINPEDAKSHNILSTDLVANTNIIRLDKETIERRLNT